LNVHLIAHGLLVPLHIVCLNICHNLCSLLHDGEIILIFPSLEIDQLVISIDLEKFVPNFGLADISNLIGLLPPLEEVAEQLLSEHGSHRETSSEFILGDEGLFPIYVELSSLCNRHINIFFHCDVQGHILHGLPILPQLVKAVFHNISLINLTKLDGSHISLHKMLIIMNVVFPRFHDRIKRPLPKLLLLSDRVSQLVKNLR
jgi:hypothetical protein